MSVEHFRIAGLHLALDKTRASFVPTWKGFHAYRQHAAPVGGPDIRVDAYAGTPPSFRDADLLERGPGFWSAYALGDRTLFTCKGQGQHPGVWRAVVSDREAQNFEVITERAPSFIASGAALPDPLAFPSAELIVLSHIAQRDAAILHACAVRDPELAGAGYVFCGRSGVGKSTTAGLWQGHGEVLNDDRVMVRRDRRSGFRVHGTPWHGDLPVTNPGSAPLAAVFFLEHAANHQLSPLSAAQAEREIMTSAWLPLWDRQGGLAETMRLCRELVRSVPCFRLRFRRDRDVLQHVRAAAIGGIPEPASVPV